MYFELTSAVSTASILPALGISGADHSLSDPAWRVLRGTFIVGQDGDVDLVEDRGDVIRILSGQAPSHRGGEFADKVLCRVGVGETDREDFAGEGDGRDRDEGHVVLQGAIVVVFVNDVITRLQSHEL